jgi:RND family efflux transporter MFP subunit
MTPTLYRGSQSNIILESTVRISRWGAGLAAAAIVTAGFNFFPINDAGSTLSERRTTQAVLSTIDESITATGVIRPVTGAEVNVGSRISGTVVSLPAEVGDRVEVGELLAELDATALRAEVDQAAADVALAVPRVELAESTLKRREQLAAKGLISEEDVEIASRDLDVERAQLDANRARLRAAEIAVSYTRISAPISGVVAEVSTREGETVAAAFAAPNFVTIIDLDRLELLAYVDETDIGRVEIGQQASFSVDTYPGAEFPARVTAIQPRAELQGSVVNYVVRLAFKRPADYTLRPEMTAHVRVLVEQRERVLTTLRAAIKRNFGRQYVVVQRNGKWVEQDVATGWRSESTVEILSGLREGEVLEFNER